jgi:hypothetical protein
MHNIVWNVSLIPTFSSIKLQPNLQKEKSALWWAPGLICGLLLLLLL